MASIVEFSTVGGGTPLQNLATRGAHDISLTGTAAKLRTAAKWAGTWEVAAGGVRISYTGMLMLAVPAMTMSDAVRALKLLA